MRADVVHPLSVTLASPLRLVFCVKEGGDDVVDDVAGPSVSGFMRGRVVVTW